MPRRQDSIDTVSMPPRAAHSVKARGTGAGFELHLSDCLAWLKARAENSIEAIVTDPPYGLREYTELEKGKLRSGRGGVWRIPPALGGSQRSPLPRFTVLTSAEPVSEKEGLT